MKRNIQNIKIKENQIIEKKYKVEKEEKGSYEDKATIKITSILKDFSKTPN